MSSHADSNGSRREPLNRRLAAIVVVDVVGYTRLMESNETETHALWKEMASGVIAEEVVRHRGRIVKSTGDGFLLEFASIVDAVIWSFEVQERFGVREVERPEAAIRLRIAVNVGDIIHEPEDIFGSGVNIAARLQEFAEPGGIVISGLVHEQVQPVIRYQARDLGLVHLKNIDRPVRAYAVNRDTRAGKMESGILAQDRRHRPSIAVLPIRSLGGGAPDDYFAEGIVHDITASLANLKELFVVSSSSTICFRATDIDPAVIGRQLGVRYLVTGSMVRGMDRLRMNVQLSDTDTRNVVWAGRYDVLETDLFTTQDTIAAQVAQTLVPHLRRTEHQRALRKRPESMDAYETFLQGLYRLYRLEPGDFDGARELLLQAIERDPLFAAPYAYMAKWHIINIGQGYIPHHRKGAEEALRYAELALERDDSDPLALAVYGHTMSFLLRRYDEALAAFERAIEISPNSPVTWGLSSPTFAYTGDGAQAVIRAEEAVRLTPLDPYAFFYQTVLAVAYYTHGNYEDAVRWGYRAMAANRRFTASPKALIVSLVAMDRLDEARQVANTLLELEPGFRIEPYCAWYPIRDPEALKLYAQRLVAAGLPS